jgi:excisionase family DNA binding protein
MNTEVNAVPGVIPGISGESIGQAAPIKLTIDAKQAAKYIGISYWSILEMCKRGEIPYIPVGNRKLFRMESLIAWLAARETGGMRTI